MIRTTVYFATNRRENPAASDPAQRFGAAMSDLTGAQLAWGTAFVEGTDPDPRRLLKGRIDAIQDVASADMPQAMRDDILGSGKNLLVFIHGFANSFPDAITRAAFNREWLAASGRAEADCTVLAFTWPSPGLVVNPGDVPAGVAISLLSLLGLAINHQLRSPLTHRYQQDQGAARASGAAFAVLLDGITPLLREIRAAGRRTYLLAHSMGHIVLQNAIDAWQASHRAPERLFDHAVLAAADAAAAEAGHAPPWLLSLPLWAAITSAYVSDEDVILLLSESINGTARLGYKGPPGQGDAMLFPPPRTRFVACGRLRDDGPGSGADGSHQYYRRLPAVRDDIVLALAGQGAPGQVRLVDGA